jgi:hypothetical protein
VPAFVRFLTFLAFPSSAPIMVNVWEVSDGCVIALFQLFDCRSHGEPGIKDSANRALAV